MGLEIHIQWEIIHREARLKMGRNCVSVRLLAREEGLQLGLGASGRDDKGLMGF